MNLTGLPTDLVEFVEQELTKGKYRTEADLVCEAVRLLRERERRLEELLAEVLPAVEQLNRGEYTAYDKQGLREMLEDVKAHSLQAEWGQPPQQPTAPHYVLQRPHYWDRGGMLGSPGRWYDPPGCTGCTAGGAPFMLILVT